MALDLDNISKKQGKKALSNLWEAVVTCLLFENVKELYSLYSKSEYASLFLFKLEVSRRLGKLVIKFGVEHSLWNYEDFGGHLPQVDDDGEEDSEDEDGNYDGNDFDAMWDRAMKMVE